MSNRYLLVAAATLSLATAAPAQERANEQAARLRARIDSLLPEYHAALIAVARADSQREEQRHQAQRVPLDTLEAAPFIVVALRSQSPKVFEVARAAIAERIDLVAGLPATDRITLLVQIGEEYRPYRRLQMLPRHSVVWLPSTGRSSRLRTAMLAGIDDALMVFLPAEVRAWTAEARWSKSGAEPHIFRELAASSTEVTRQCFRDNVGACVDALGLGRELPRDAWYSTQQMRAFVGRLYGRSALKTLCIEAGNRDACIEVLSHHNGAPPPLSHAARASLLRFAVDRGGAGALASLQNASTPADALAAASRTDLHTVVREWRASIQEKRPMANAGAGKIALATLLWVAVVLGLAMRSTRERL